MTEVIMPKMGDGMEEGTLVEWLKKDGESVKSGEVIGTIQTDKATLELEAPSSGTLTGFLIQPGDTVGIGKTIAALLKAGETLPPSWGSGASAPTAPPEEKATIPDAEAAASDVNAEPVLAGARIKASPLARKIASDAGLNLGEVIGSGPGGRIIEKDVRAAMSAGAPISKPSVQTASSLSPTASDQVIKLGKLRQITAQRTTESKQTVPHFYVTVEVDIEKILQLRKMFESESSGKVSINDFVIKACCTALQQMPVVNSSFQNGQLLQHGEIHIGIAAALDEGLTVPVMRGAGNMSLREISSASKDLVTRAHDNKLKLDELSGSTFSISNMGMLKVDTFAAIINVPNAAILAIGSATKRAVVNDVTGEIVARARMNITGSFDHRVVDGAVGAEFMNLVRDGLENPTRLLS